MNYVDPSTAKAIVKRDLRNWTGTFSQFESIVQQMVASKKDFHSIKKREEYLNNKFDKVAPKIFRRYVPARYSNMVGLLGMSEGSEAENTLITSKSERRKANEAIAKNNKIQHELNSRHLNAFVVKDDHQEGNGNLIIVIFNPYAENREELKEYFPVVFLERHCLERIVQRLGLTNIYEAFDEVLTAIMLLEGSCKELAVRQPPENIDDFHFKRHVPTKNGALLLVTNSYIAEDGVLTLQSNLRTWISKNQFKVGQQVTLEDFNFAQIINYYLSGGNDLDRQLEMFQASYERMCSKPGVKVKFTINGFLYDYEKVISTLKHRKYLDFMLDFDK